MDSRASRSGVGESEFRKGLFGTTSSTSVGNKKYDKLRHDDEENEAFLADTIQQQQQVIHMQDSTLDKIGSSVGVLKDMSQKIGTEINEHLVIMDDLGNSMERTDTTMSFVMKKLNKVSRMADDKTQWTLLIVLLVILIIVILLFFVL
jgi:t-SNARE complex subunit (syntaxin)